MKSLYSFTLTNKELVDTSETSTNEKGETVTISKKEEKEIPYTFNLRSVGRALEDSGRLFYLQQHSFFVKSGVLSSALLNKRFKDDDGALSKQEEEEQAKLHLQLTEKQKELEVLAVIKEEERNEEQKNKLNLLLSEITKIQTKLTNFQIYQLNLFNSTAESAALEKTLIWWILQLAYKGEEPFFKGNTYEEKLPNYDNILENEEETFEKRVAKYFSFLISYWFYTKDSEIKPKKSDWDQAFSLAKDRIDGAKEELNVNSGN